MEQTAPSKSNLTLTGRNSLSLTGVKKIRSTEPACVVAVLDTSTVVITGSNLSVQNVSVSAGTLDLSGSVTSIRYTSTHEKQRFSFKNIFK